MSRFQGEDFQAVLLGNKLYVFGRTTVPSPAYLAGFYKSNPQGTNPTQLILDFGWYARPGTWTQQQVEIPVEYTLEDGATNYNTVLLRDPLYGYAYELVISKGGGSKAHSDLVKAAKEAANSKITFKVKIDGGVGKVLVADKHGNVVLTIKGSGSHDVWYKKGNKKIPVFIDVPMKDGASITISILQGKKEIYKSKKFEKSGATSIGPVEIK